MLVHNKGSYIRHIGNVRLIPGVNDLDNSDAINCQIKLDNSSLHM